MGKYKMRAITPACLASFATSPAIKPMLRVDATARSQLPPKASSWPSRAWVTRINQHQGEQGRGYSSFRQTWLYRFQAFIGTVPFSLSLRGE